MNIFLAGATGVIGRRLVQLLRDAGHAVTGTSRSGEKASALEVLGARGVVVDVYDARALLKAMSAAHPDVVIHQLTDLPQSLDAGRPSNFEGNARLRIEGTKNLMAAASVLGARRVIAQSIAFIYADGPGARGARRAGHRRRGTAVWPALWPRHLVQDRDWDRRSLRRCGCACGAARCDQGAGHLQHRRG
jgi:nucleoside-diphosphate-sugar epimerase